MKLLFSSNSVREYIPHHIFTVVWRYFESPLRKILREILGSQASNVKTFINLDVLFSLLKKKTNIEVSRQSAGVKNKNNISNLQLVSMTSF